MFPIHLTDRALAQVQKLVTKDGREDAFLRLGVKGGGCSGLEYVIRLDTDQRANDVVGEFGNLRVVCDAKSAKYLEGSTFDFTGNLLGGGFKFSNPNAERSCGCGTSFAPRKSA